MRLLYGDQRHAGEFQKEIKEEKTGYDRSQQFKGLWCRF